MHSIQVLKEQPELSRKDPESNLVHCEPVHLPRRSTRWISVGLYCWEHQFQEEDNGTLRLCPDPQPQTWKWLHSGCPPRKCAIRWINDVWRRIRDMYSYQGPD